MKVFTITTTNDKEWFNRAEVFMDFKSALTEWNGIMLDRDMQVLQLDEAGKRLEEDEFLLHTYIDDYGRKWGVELSKTKLRG
jgi:hypothetical protein